MYNVPVNTRDNLNSLVNLVKKKLNFAELKVPFFIAGGSAFAAINNTKYNDIDVYLYNQEDIKILQPLIEMSRVHETPNAITFKEVQEVEKCDIQINSHGNPKMFFDKADICDAAWDNGYADDSHEVQLIKCKFGLPGYIFDTYDINCCMCGITSDYEIVFDPRWSQNIQINTDEMGADILHRYEKYIKKKGAQDTLQRELKRILTHMINNSDVKLKDTKGSGNPLGKDISVFVVISGYFGCTAGNHDIHQFVHDYICVMKSSQERVDIFEVLNNLLCDELCDEYNLHSLVRLMESKYYNSESISDVNKRIINKFPEYFI